MILYFLRKWQRFPPKACIFLEGYQKNQKTKDFGLFNPRLRQDSKIFGFFGFFGTSSGNGNVFHKKIAFSWRGAKKTKKTKKNKDFGLFRPRLRQDSKIFGFLGFFGTSSQNGHVSHKKLAFSWRGAKKTKKTKKTKDFGLFNPRLRQDSKIFVFFVFFGTSSGNGNVFHKKLAFSWRGTKKTKKPKILDSSILAFAKTLKSLVFSVFLVPPQEMAMFSTKRLHFPGGVPKKTKKPKILDSSSLAFAKTLKSLVFWLFLVPPHKMATFSTKSLHFPGGVPKKPKNQRFWTLQSSPSPRL